MARSFNGSTDIITGSAFATGSAWPSSGVTVAGWALFSSLAAAYQTCAAKPVGNPATQDTVFVGNSTGANLTKLAWYMGSAHKDPGLATISTATWYHVAISYDTTVGLQTWLNGVSDGTAAAAGALTIDTAQAWCLGHNPPGDGDGNLSGSLADWAVWNVTLKQAEVIALAKGIRPGLIRPLSLITWYPLDGLESPEPDLSGNARNGTLTGTALSFGPPITMITRRWPQVNEAQQFINVGMSLRFM